MRKISGGGIGERCSEFLTISKKDIEKVLNAKLEEMDKKKEKERHKNTRFRENKKGE